MRSYLEPQNPQNQSVVEAAKNCWGKWCGLEMTTCWRGMVTWYLPRVWKTTAPNQRKKPRFLGNKQKASPVWILFFFPIAVNSITIWTSLPSRPDVFVWLPKFLESPMHKENCKISVGVVMKPEVLPSLCLYRKMHSALDQFLLSLIFLIISLQCIAIRGHCWVLMR